MPRGKRTAKKTETTLVPTSIEPVLPGEAEVEAELLDQAVQTINQIHAGKTLETARMVGEYVLQTFFADDPESFRARGKKHVSFRELAKRDDLHPSYAFIWRAVSVVDQLRLLPEDVVAALPYTHHAALLPVRDEGAKKRLAQRAAEKGWTSRKLLDEVRKVRAKEKGAHKAGRPPLPAFVKVVRRISSTLRASGTPTITDEDIIRYTPDLSRELVGIIESQVDVLMAIRDDIEKMLKEAEQKSASG